MYNETMVTSVGCIDETIEQIEQTARATRKNARSNQVQGNSANGNTRVSVCHSEIPEMPEPSASFHRRSRDPSAGNGRNHCHALEAFGPPIIDDKKSNFQARLRAKGIGARFDRKVSETWYRASIGTCSNVSTTSCITLISVVDDVGTLGARDQAPLQSRISPAA
ncbi:hypothetical protein K0M31_012257 [Melipona bicolor]|uniref:Uncharacterized protein n=1 Tax=Melipona bicolor TaxID=60889 RepID=A0AA40FK73_9HYME|nr:hypothetical protein K0M31_012257 [Melipona bicolor]